MNTLPPLTVTGDPIVLAPSTPEQRLGSKTAKKSCAKCLLHPVPVTIASTLLWGVSMWLVSLSSTGLDTLEVLAAFFAGDASGSFIGCCIGLLQLKMQNKPLRLSVSSKSWKTWVTAIVFPLLSIGGFTAYSLAVDYADGAVAMFAPLSGLAILPSFIIELVLKKKCPTVVKLIGFLLSLAAVVAASWPSEDELLSNESATLNLTTPILVDHGAGDAHYGSQDHPPEDTNSDFPSAIAAFVACFVMWGSSWAISSFVVSEIKLFDRCTMWLICEATLTAGLTFTLYLRDPGNFFGLPYTSPVFMFLFSAHILNKLGIVSYSEACANGGSVGVVAPIANMYPLVAAILSIVLSGEVVTPQIGIALACAVLGPVFLAVKIPYCKSHAKVAPAQSPQPNPVSKEVTAEDELQTKPARKKKKPAIGRWVSFYQEPRTNDDDGTTKDEPDIKVNDAKQSEPESKADHPNPDEKDDDRMIAVENLC